jgi:hypothetical protein
MNTMTLRMTRFITVTAIILGLSVSLCHTTFGQLSALPPQVWPHNPITVSFAPDNVAIGKFRNELQQHLKTTLDERQWRIEILRACQEWSRHSGVDFALIGDSPRNFGVPGLSQRDPRFGDIRFGAFPQTNVLGNAVPYQPNAGVWAGDIFLDTNTTYEIQNPGNSQPVPNKVDLYSVALHEIGNTLGLVDEMLDPESVMFFRYIGVRQGLSPVDIQNIQFLYGPKVADPYEEQRGNEKLATATIIDWSSDFAITSSQTVRGRVNSPRDRDIYRIRGNALSEKLWVTVNSRGISLLCPKLTILDDEGKVIDTIGAESPLDNTVTKELTSFYDNETRYLVVEWNDVPDFDSGDYEIVLNLSEPVAQPSLWETNDDDDKFFSDKDDEALEDRLFELAGAIDTEIATNDTPASATRLLTPNGMNPGTRFETIGSLLQGDVDTYAIQAASDSSGSLMLHLRPLTTSFRQLSIAILDSNYKALNSTITYHADGDIDLELARATPNAQYYIVVSSSQSYAEPINYVLVTDIASVNASLDTIQQVRLTAAASDVMGSMTTYKTQLFKFALNVQSPDKINQAVQLTIYSETGRAEATIVCKAGSSARNLVWLHAGKHTFRFTALTNNGRRINTSTSTLRGASVSDDEGPILIDPSGNPVSGTQLPDNNAPPTPLWEFPRFLLGLILPPENPWFSPLSPSRTP